MFDWSNRMIGREDAEYQDARGGADENAAMELFAYAGRALRAEAGRAPARIS